MLVLVDAANVVGSRPDGWWRDRAGAAARLVASLQQLASRPDLAYDVVVVLEGRARAGAGPGLAGRVDVRHAPGSGDDLLTELCGPGVLLVTSDRELRARGAARQADVVGPQWLLRQLDAGSS